MEVWRTFPSYFYFFIFLTERSYDKERTVEEEKERRERRVRGGGRRIRVAVRHAEQDIELLHEGEHLFVVRVRIVSPHVLKLRARQNSR